jgi:hypothetical protein
MMWQPHQSLVCFRTGLAYATIFCCKSIDVNGENHTDVDISMKIERTKE